MKAAWSIFDLALIGAGYAACWFTKDRIMKIVLGADSFVKSLEAKIAALKK